MEALSCWERRARCCRRAHRACLEERAKESRSTASGPSTAFSFATLQASSPPHSSGAALAPSLRRTAPPRAACSLASFPFALRAGRSFLRSPFKGVAQGSWRRQAPEESPLPVPAMALARAVASLAPRVAGRRVAVGLSGGVDSAVSALLLLRAGASVSAAFARTWDAADERGDSSECQLERDFRDAQAVASRLRIPLTRPELVREYWTSVFEPFLSEYSAGRTPNPDLECNRFVKFGSLQDAALSSTGADLFATGHYARLRFNSSSSQPHLFRGVDREKDQSYFLARTLSHQLSRAVFPVGSLTREQVRELARQHSLPTADKKGSAGICFIGRRKMGDFLSRYIEMDPGTIVDVDTDEPLEYHSGSVKLTVGQKAGVGGAGAPYYVAWKCGSTVYAACGHNHPALFARGAVVDEGRWVSGERAPFETSLPRDGEREAHFASKPRYRHPDVQCALHRQQPGRLIATFEQPVRAVTPGQALVVYKGEECLGSCTILDSIPLTSPQRNDASSAAEQQLSAGDRRAAAAT